VVNSWEKCTLWHLSLEPYCASSCVLSTRLGRWHSNVPVTTDSIKQHHMPYGPATSRSKLMLPCKLSPHKTLDPERCSLLLVYAAQRDATKRASAGTAWGEWHNGRPSLACVQCMATMATCMHSRCSTSASKMGSRKQHART
jgi:hypothetical protein